MNKQGEHTAEIFAVGTWNGLPFSRQDLQAIADNFATFSRLLKVPLKFGHNDKQPLTDGMPALGWVDSVWVDGSKLFAKFTEVPDIVLRALKKKLYRKVSIELDHDVSYRGEKFSYVLSGVALLGADIPAVSTLNDLDHFMTRRAVFSAGRRLCFETSAGELNTGESDMDLKELSDKVVALSAQVAALTATNAELTKYKADTEARFAREADERKTREAEELKQKAAAKRTEAIAVFDEAVRAGAITPAQKQTYSKTMRLDDDTVAAGLDINDVKAMFAGRVDFSKQQGHGQGDGGSSDPDSGKPADVVLAARASALINEGKASDFLTAQRMVFSADPELARRYLNVNDQKKGA